MNRRKNRDFKWRYTADILVFERGEGTLSDLREKT
jgi:hypothetical protein